MFVVWGENYLCWGLFSNFFCTFGTVTINVPPLYCWVFFPHGMENQGLQTVIIDRSVSILVAKPDMLTPVIPTHGRYRQES